MPLEFLINDPDYTNVKDTGLAEANLKIESSRVKLIPKINGKGYYKANLE